jgi:SAM-dependent methyltransferase
LRHLVAIGVLSGGTGEEAYSLTELGRGLLSDHRDGLRAAIDTSGAVGRAELACLQLLNTVLTGLPAYPMVYGRSCWKDLAADTDLGGSFDELMAAHDPSPIVAGYPWDTLADIVDAGGGTGTVLAALLSAYPRLRGILLELSGPAEGAQRRFAERGLAGRASAVAGSFFDPLPPGAGAYLLCNLIHDWNDDDAIRILRRCAEAAGAAGRVLVIDSALREVDGAGGTRADLSMLVCVGGRERTLDELEGLGTAADLKMRQARPVGNRYLLEFVAV